MLFITSKKKIFYLLNETKEPFRAKKKSLTRFQNVLVHPTKKSNNLVLINIFGKTFSQT